MELYHPNETGLIFKGGNWVPRTAIARVHWHCWSPGLLSTCLPSIVYGPHGFSLGRSSLAYPLTGPLTTPINVPRAPTSLPVALTFLYDLHAPLSNCLLTTALLDVPVGMSKLIPLFSLNKPNHLPAFLVGRMVDSPSQNWGVILHSSHFPPINHPGQWASF